MSLRTSPPNSRLGEDSSARLAVSREAQVEIARVRRALAIRRYEVGVRRGSAWLEPSRQQKAVVGD